MGPQFQRIAPKIADQFRIRKTRRPLPWDCPYYLLVVLFRANVASFKKRRLIGKISSPHRTIRVFNKKSEKSASVEYVILLRFFRPLIAWQSAQPAPINLPVTQKTWRIIIAWHTRRLYKAYRMFISVIGSILRLGCWPLAFLECGKKARAEKRYRGHTNVIRIASSSS